MAIAMFVGTYVASAQSIVLHNIDGTTQSFDANLIDSISFTPGTHFGGNGYHVSPSDLNSTTWQIVNMPGLDPSDIIYERFASNGTCFVYSKKGLARLATWNISDGLLISNVSGAFRTLHIHMNENKDTLIAENNIVLAKVNANDICGNWIVAGTAVDDTRREFRCNSMMGFYPDGTSMNFHIHEDGSVGDRADSVSYTYTNGKLCWGNGVESDVEVVNNGFSFTRKYNGRNYYYIPFATEDAAITYQQTMLLNSWDTFSFDGNLSGDNTLFLYDQLNGKEVSGLMYNYGSNIGVMIHPVNSNGSTLTMLDVNRDFQLTYANHRMVMNGDNGVFVLSKLNRLHHFYGVWRVDDYISDAISYSTPGLAYVVVKPNGMCNLWGMSNLQNKFIEVAKNLPYSFHEEYDAESREFITTWTFNFLGEELGGIISTKYDENGLVMNLKSDATTIKLTRVNENIGMINQNTSSQIFGSWSYLNSGGSLFTSSGNITIPGQSSVPTTDYQPIPYTNPAGFKIVHMTVFNENRLGMTIYNQAIDSSRIVIAEYTYSPCTLSSMPDVSDYIMKIFQIPNQMALNAGNLSIRLADNSQMDFLVVGVGNRIALIVTKQQYIDYLRSIAADNAIIQAYEMQTSNIILYDMFNK